MNLKNYIGNYFYETIGVNNETKYEIIDEESSVFFCKNRLDLMAKWMLLKFTQENIQSNLAITIYKEHLKAFSDGTFSEPGNEKKNSLKSYLDEFRNIFNDMEIKGFDKEKSIIPVGYDNVIIDGGHRVAIADYLNLKITIARFDKIKGPVYDYRFFRERGMREDYLDFLILNYCEKKGKNIFVCCVWPITSRLKKKVEIENCIKKYAQVIYKKKVRFSYRGLKNFQILTYGHQDWVGVPEDHYEGIESKVNLCYANSDTCFYIIEGGNIKDMIKLKEEIRSYYNIGKHSIHITDNFQESLSILHTVLNQNTIFFLNNNKPYDNKEFISLLSNISDENIICYSPDFTLAAYGLLDVQYIDIDNCNINNEIEFDIRYDYNNFFYFFDKKMLTPQRAEEIDMKHKDLYMKIKKKKDRKIKETLSVQMRIIKYRIKKIIINFLKRVKLFDLVYFYMKNRR